MKTALISLHANRPRYSKQVLDAIDHQANGLFHIASLEDSCPEKEEINTILCNKSSNYSGMDIIFHKGISHTNNNLIHALNHLISLGFDSYIYMEDDTLFSKSAVKYLQKYYRIHKNDPKFSHVAIGTLEDGYEVNEKNLSKVKYEYDWCSLWGYMAPIKMAYRLLDTTRPIKTKEDREEIRENHELVWDFCYGDWFKSQAMFCITPLISRLNNIGVEGGLHSFGKTWESWEGL